MDGATVKNLSKKRSNSRLPLNTSFHTDGALERRHVTGNIWKPPGLL
jgi:hypothetical protein